MQRIEKKLSASVGDGSPVVQSAEIALTELHGSIKFLSNQYEMGCTYKRIYVTFI
jgi:hypothetical protein